MLGFNSLLEAVGLDPAKVRLVRHRHGREYQRLVYQDAIRQDTRFEQYQSGQCNKTVIDQMCSADAVAAFVVDPGGETVFVGLWRVKGSRKAYLPDPYVTAARPPLDGSVIIKLERMTALREYCGRIVIDWGGGERAWVQYADRRDKEIVEVRRRAEEPHFPGFGRFACGLHEVDALPATWLEALRASRGVYLLIHRESGAQYVGSATQAVPSTVLGQKVVIRNIGLGPACEITYDIKSMTGAQQPNWKSSCPYLLTGQAVEIALPRSFVATGEVQFEAAYKSMANVNFRSRQILSNGAMGPFTIAKLRGKSSRSKQQGDM